MPALAADVERHLLRILRDQDQFSPQRMSDADLVHDIGIESCQVRYDHLRLADGIPY